MKIKELELSHFRNYEGVRVCPGPGKNVFYGKNAQGKTNLLEGVALGITGRSFRTYREREVISLDGEVSEVRVLLERGGYEHQSLCRISRGEKKGLFLDGEEVKSLREFQLGTTVIFEPEDLNMIKHSPGERRRYMDRTLSLLNPWYEKTLGDYRKVLDGRNRLLKRRSMDPKDPLLRVFGRQLAPLSVELVRERLKFLKALSAGAKEYYGKLSGGRESLATRYLSTVPYAPDREEMIAYAEESLLRSLDRDLRYGRTTIGPHRDDIQFLVEERDLRSYGSQGQQRSAVLALKLAEVDFVRETKGFSPVLLLDDVFSELDAERKGLLLESIHRCQCFITTAEYPGDPGFREGELYSVKEGNIVKLKPS